MGPNNVHIWLFLLLLLLPLLSIFGRKLFKRFLSHHKMHIFEILSKYDLKKTN